jgi:hypothetical protein
MPSGNDVFTAAQYNSVFVPPIYAARRIARVVKQFVKNYFVH